MLGMVDQPAGSIASHSQDPGHAVQTTNQCKTLSWSQRTPRPQANMLEVVKTKTPDQTDSRRDRGIIKPHSSNVEERDVVSVT